MMKVVHKESGGDPVEIARKNWEDQTHYTSDSWKVVDEGSPILLLKKKEGSNEYFADKLYDLELTIILLERFGDEFKVEDYQHSTIKPAVPIDRKKLGIKYLKYFDLVTKDKNKSTKANKAKTLGNDSIFQKIKIVNDEDTIDLNDELEIVIDPFVIEDDPIKIINLEEPNTSKWDLEYIMRILGFIVVIDLAFVGGYYFHSNYIVGVMPTNIIFFTTIIIGAFVAGYFVKELVGKMLNKNKDQ